MSSRLRNRPLATGFIEPCRPTLAREPPAGTDWLHEIKHDGYRLIAWRDGDAVRLYSRHSTDLTERYPAVVATLLALRMSSCLIDGELVVCDDASISSFERLRSHKHDHVAFLYAFDLLKI